MHSEGVEEDACRAYVHGFHGCDCNILKSAVSAVMIRNEWIEDTVNRGNGIFATMS